MTGERGVFDKRVNEVARACFVRGNEHLATKDVVADWIDAPNRISDLLMHHDSVCFSVYGENLLLPILFKAYGLKGLRDLLEQGAIRFRLEKHQIAYFTEGPKGIPKGVHPLSAMRHDSPPHADPKASVDLGFRRMTSKPPEKALRKLKKELVAAYAPEEQLATKFAIDFAHQGYQLGRFRFAGLSPEIGFDEMTDEHRKLLAKLAGEMHDLCTVSALGLDLIDQQMISKVLDDSLDTIGKAARTEEAIRRVFSIEGVPDLRQLFRENPDTVKNVPKLRGNRHAVNFRRWISSATEDKHGPEIGQEYLSSLRGETGWMKYKPTGATRSLVVSAASTAVGGLLGEAYGGLLAGVIVDQTFDLADKLILERMLAGWKPRSYFDEVVRKSFK